MKSLIVNRFTNVNKHIPVPAGSVEADSFAASMLDSAYEVFELSGTAGSDVVASYNFCSAMGYDTTTDSKTYVDLRVKSTVTDDEVRVALTGLTVNGVKFDEVSIVNFRQVTV